MKEGKAVWVITNLSKDGHKATGQRPKQWQRGQSVQSTTVLFLQHLQHPILVSSVLHRGVIHLRLQY